ncbi:MAG: FHA domain-containing protein [bacterium]
MEITEMTLWLARMGVLALLFIFLVTMVFALFADARAASRPEPAPPAALPGVKSLAVVSGPIPATGQYYLLDRPLTIGRADDNDIILLVDLVSAHHARTNRLGDDWLLEDLHSTNGTLHNDTLIKTPTRLAIGDRIQLAETVLEVR